MSLSSPVVPWAWAASALKLATRPTEVAKKQALAAVGQVLLMKYYVDFLGALDVKCAQVLLTWENIADKDQFYNARNTFAQLLAYGVVPVVNENDTVAVQELRFGDNDTLSAKVAALVEADYLFLLTDVDCLYTANPRDDPNAKPIWEVHDMDNLMTRVDTGGGAKGSQWGTGGMATKLTAARIATEAGCKMVIANSEKPDSIIEIGIHEAQERGTIFHPKPRVN
eukprot:CAMPEP_0175045594 /NCGR_PEP_ID=MMETSP0052_2-20121109/4519_1 /TAXON_ID=51329 ORGANISM="Polytomella parva, Strain SAG 63-3" /NCGR_SAMPLE_ID=MMETSP0052_2 /ASSEMBLY_ACC=CAM_ASM_000194 /LENGTH=224 /DNA_ID=CAMNT_0016309161 /DNA_START=303 /DNA_END=976 /DNA_ORIENTATION=+